jgi:hypothetical protein
MKYVFFVSKNACNGQAKAINSVKKEVTYQTTTRDKGLDRRLFFLFLSILNICIET